MTRAHEPSTGESVDASHEVRKTIAVNMRKTRLSRGLSIRELAERTGISAALLSQIERGNANTTIDALTKLAVALDLSFADLTWRYLAEPQVVRAHEGDVVEHPSGAVRTVFGSTDRRRFEISIGVVEAGRLSERSTHGIGSVEYTVVISGGVTVETPEWSILLDRGDAVRFSGELEHAYRAGAERAEILTLVSSTDDWNGSAEPEEPNA
ncbi:helix-turn-helix domain-containing protein [Leucobacter weissii]|uniref:Helix-turn-helix domain-containing protein n=1 Tax=Leucobacter weissii TaxID=1983706 RepID=A0A939S720_9MICO|nr:XRE family transcriptional regulator [Leucobacter weissii]MBO1900506.1 helix-turn-helix domain-containing protein [Leucobacter weissii]